VNTGGLEADALCVEVYADPLRGGEPERYRAVRLRDLKDGSGLHVWSAAAPASRPATDYTARVLPCFEGVSVPLEANNILWLK
jgi:glycogen phosphorylase